jgi:hypothetical protein
MSRELRSREAITDYVLKQGSNTDYCKDGYTIQCLTSKYLVLLVMNSVLLQLLAQNTLAPPPFVCVHAHMRLELLMLFQNYFIPQIIFLSGQ